MRDKSKIKKVLSQTLEPFALGLLALFFILPIITVMNLTPITKQIKKLDVLGITTQEDLVIRLVGGKHEVFVSESLNKVEDNEYAYSVRLGKRSADSYSKPILEIENRTDKEKTIGFWGQTLSNTRSTIFLIVNEEIYRIQDSQGETYEIEIVVPSGDKVIVFLGLENLSGIQFSEVFDMTITPR